MRFPAKHAACFAVLSGAAIVFGARPSLAQTVRRSESGDAVARVQAQFQQLSAERAALQEENRTLKEKQTKLDAQLKKLQGEKQGLDARLQRTEGQLSLAERDKQSTASNLEAQESRLKEVVAKYRELAENLRTMEGERNRLAGELEVRRGELGKCSRDNVDLAGLANDALDRYEQKGCFAALAQREPFTQIQKARVQNYLDEYRGRIDALKLPPKPEPGPAAGAVAPAKAEQSVPQ
jgi:chromosome segregation ATPase